MVAKFVDSAQLKPWLNPAWYPYGKVIINSPASCVTYNIKNKQTNKKNQSEQHYKSSCAAEATKTVFAFATT